MDAITLSDRLEEHWDDWHLDFDAKMIEDRRRGEKIENPLDDVDRNAERIVEVFDEWRPYRSKVTDQELHIGLDNLVEPRYKIGSAAFVEGAFDRGKDYTWTPYTMRTCLRTRVESIMELTRQKRFLIGEIYTMIRDCFVQAMKHRGVELDVATKKTSGIEAVSSLAVLEDGVNVTDEQEELIWNNLALITYGFLAQANRDLVNVPFDDEDITIDKEREAVPFSDGIKEYVQGWSSGMAPDIRQGDGNLWVYAKYNNRIVGFASGRVSNSSQHYDFVKVGGIAVNSNYQGRGIGQRLLSEFEQSMPEHIRRLTAEAVISSLPFWLSQGFRDKGMSHRYGNCRSLEKELTSRSAQT